MFGPAGSLVVVAGGLLTWQFVVPDVYFKMYILQQPYMMYMRQANVMWRVACCLGPMACLCGGGIAAALLEL